METQQIKGESPNAEVLVSSIAETLKASANVSTIFGTPIERSTITVVPVSKIRYGFGGGSGGKGGTGGGGGGGGIDIVPVGFIEVNDEEATFKPIVNGALLGLAFVVGGVLGCLLSGRLRKGPIQR